MAHTRRPTDSIIPTAFVFLPRRERERSLVLLDMYSKDIPESAVCQPTGHDGPRRPPWSTRREIFVGIENIGRGKDANFPSAVLMSPPVEIDQKRPHVRAAIGAHALSLRLS